MFLNSCCILRQLFIFTLQLWFAHRPLDDDRIRSRAYSQPDFQENSAVEIMKLNVGISSNGDVDIGEMSIAEMDPEDIRVTVVYLMSYLHDFFYFLFFFPHRL